MSEAEVRSIQEQVHATVGRTLQLVRYIEDHFGLDSAITNKAKIALESLVELEIELSKIQPRA